MSDLRDLRDPQNIGVLLREQAPSVRETYGKNIPLSEIYDVHVSKFAVPDVSKDDSMGKVCVREYRAELEARAAEGDKYARSAIDSIDAGLGVQGFDEAGV